MAADRSHTIQADRTESSRGQRRVRMHHDWQRDDSVVVSVVEAVALATGNATTAIEPLYEVVDPDAVHDLLVSMDQRGPGRIQFPLHGCDVSVDSSGAIDVRPLD